MKMREAGTRERSAGRGSDHIRCSSDLRIGDMHIVGGKNGSPRKMCRDLAGQGVSIPNGFAVTAEGYRHMFSVSGKRDRSMNALNVLEMDDKLKGGA